MAYKDKERKREYDKKYRRENKERIKERGKKRNKEEYTKNKEEIRDRLKRWKWENPLKVKEQRRRWKENNPNYRNNYYKNNRERELKLGCKWYQNNKIRKTKLQKEWNDKNKERVSNNIKRYQKTKKYLHYQRRYKKTKLKGDVRFRIKTYLRNSLYHALKTYSKEGKIWASSKYGINYKAIIEHLKPFPEDLSNYEIHHVKPLHTFNFINPDGSQNFLAIKEAFSPENHKWVTIEEHKEIHRKLNKIRGLKDKMEKPKKIGELEIYFNEDYPKIIFKIWWVGSEYVANNDDPYFMTLIGRHAGIGTELWNFIKTIKRIQKLGGKIISRTEEKMPT